MRKRLMGGRTLLVSCPRSELVLRSPVHDPVVIAFQKAQLIQPSWLPFLFSRYQEFPEGDHEGLGGKHLQVREGWHIGIQEAVVHLIEDLLPHGLGQGIQVCDHARFGVHRPTQRSLQYIVVTVYPDTRFIRGPVLVVAEMWRQQLVGSRELYAVDNVDGGERHDGFRETQRGCEHSGVGVGEWAKRAFGAKEASVSGPFRLWREPPLPQGAFQ